MTEGPIGRNVILPVDESPICQRAFNWFMKYAYRPNDVIYFAHVMHSKSDYQNFLSTLDGIPTTFTNRSFSIDYSDADNLVEKYRKLAEEANINYCSEILGGTSVTDAILNLAAERHANLIIVPTRGPKTLKRTLISGNHFNHSMFSYILVKWIIRECNRFAVWARS
ncbi:hypothetical protein Aperf_G00000027285 [Anoplocephala perfoliata]